jgi:ribosomal-protein-alanine N-acetyltransferase
MIAEWLADQHTLFIGLWEGDRLAAAQISDLGEGHLITLDVHPDFRRRGLGRRLLRATLFLQRRWGGHGLVRCEIATDNAVSLTLHEQEGFRRVGVAPRYYRDGRDAAVLVKRLT